MPDHLAQGPGAGTQRTDSGLGRPAAWLMILAGAAYPVLAHLAALSRRPGLIAASLGWLTTLALLPALRRGRPWAWATLLAAALALYLAAGTADAVLLLFLPPVLINALMAWVFGHTLRDGSMPLIERVVRTMHGPQAEPDVEIVAYARRLTWVWTALFVALATVNLLLATFARPGGLLLAAGLDPRVSVPLGVWSLFANLLNYLLVGAVFVGEYALRQRRFPQQPYRGIADFTRRLARLGAMFRPASAHGPSRDAEPPAY